MNGYTAVAWFAQRPATWGALETLEPACEAARCDASRSKVASGRNYIWRPGPEIAADLPVDYSIEFGELIRSGERRIFPQLPVVEFVAKASIAGLAILRRHLELSDEEAFSYRCLHLLFTLTSNRR